MKVFLPGSLPTSVAGDEPHHVPLWLFDCHKQRGCARHQDGHMTGGARELCVEH